ncbi:MAG: hypothetical protein QOD66_4209 [Solirubrobacteraceae bacterium]|nr:hypothetical protein [Solirubrobacteraceae bacterium]
MELHALAQSFAAVAAEYERGRPEYAPAVVGALAAELQIRPGDPVLDLAAGTGKLTRALIAGGFDVVAVEPQEALRSVLEDRVGSARVRDGVAEQIPLSAASVQAVTVADGFHWFDRPRALDEIRRVLAPGGGLAVLSTVPDWRGASWGHDLGTLLMRNRPEHPHFDGAPWQDFVRAAEGWGEPWEIRVTTYPLVDLDGILAQLASISWIAAMSEAQRTEELGRMRELLQSGTAPERMPLHVKVGLTRLVA